MSANDIITDNMAQLALLEIIATVADLALWNEQATEAELRTVLAAIARMAHTEVQTSE